jgi:hypothetical protein
VESNNFIRTEESEREDNKMCCGRRMERKYGKRWQRGGKPREEDGKKNRMKDGLEER